MTALVEMSSIRGDDGTPYHFCQVQDVTGWKRSEAALGHHALHDPLTGLANREMLSARLDLLIARNRHDETTTAVLAINLDRFKVVNDGLGHAAGDRLLIDVARRLVEGSGPQDLVARIGGDEFLRLCDRIADADEADAVAERAVRLFDEPFVAAGQPVYLTVSCGVAVVDGGSSVDDALRSADTRRCTVPRTTAATTPSTLTNSCARRSPRRFDLEREIRFALDGTSCGSFSSRSSRSAPAELVGVEALSRWDHPTAGAFCAQTSSSPSPNRAGSSPQSGPTCLSWLCARSCAGARSSPAARSSGCR